MKRAFSLVELIFTIFILILIAAFAKSKYTNNDLENAANKIILYLKQTRYQSLIDEKESKEETLWYKKRWTLKFFRCRRSEGGIYYSIYSDNNQTGHPNLEESLSDPLTNKKIYSSNKCKVTKETSKYVLLTKEYGIDNVEVSCNNTSSIGQISFGSDGKVYSKLSNYENQKNEYEIKNKCVIKLISQKQGIKEIYIEPRTGYVYEG